MKTPLLSLSIHGRDRTVFIKGKHNWLARFHTPKFSGFLFRSGFVSGAAKGGLQAREFGREGKSEIRRRWLRHRTGARIHGCLAGSPSPQGRRKAGGRRRDRRVEQYV